MLSLIKLTLKLVTYTSIRHYFNHHIELHLTKKINSPMKNILTNIIVL